MYDNKIHKYKVLVLRVNITTKGPTNNYVLTDAKQDLNKKRFYSSITFL